MSLSKITASLKRKVRKRKVLRAALSLPQSNNGVINLHRMDTNNIGDWYCAPHHYFKELQGTALDIFDYKSEDPVVANNYSQQIANNALIIGGGGLLNRSGFKLQMNAFEKLPEKGKKIVLWGVGHNEKSPATYGNVTSYNVNTDKFGLVGTRDVNMPGAYVPCVSCLHPIFDKTYTTSQEFGVILHKDTVKKPKITTLFEAYPTTSNTTNLEELINFIGASEKVVTDSYHAMYWSMLLQKPVVVIPNSSKFYDFKHKPVISDFENALQSFQQAQKFPGLLEECREINRSFAQKAFDYLNL